MVWYNGRISPGTVGLGAMINILIIAVLGGMKHPIGAFIGAIVFVLLQNFAIDLVVRERFNLVIGGVFLAIVLFSPDGLLGLVAKPSHRLDSASPTAAQAAFIDDKKERDMSREQEIVRAQHRRRGRVGRPGRRRARRRRRSRSACWPPWKGRSRRRARTACAAPTWR